MKFEFSLKTYDENAVVQKDCARKLIEKLINTTGRNFGQIFEIGCLTGVLTKIIKSELSFKSLFLNDIVDITKCIENKLPCSSDSAGAKAFIWGDIEKIKLEKLPPKTDLIISNACFQWFKDFEGTVLKLKETLNTNGIIAFTTFGSENFKTFKSITGIGLNYRNIKPFIEKNFEVLLFEEELIKLEFESPRMILKHIQKTGSGGLSNGKWNKNALRNFEKNFKPSYLLEYNPIYVIIRAF